MNLWPAFRFVAIAIVCLIGSASMSLGLLAQADNQQEITVRGVLLRVAGVGGESTGWAIRLEEERVIEGKAAKSIEAEGSIQEFTKLENRHIEAVGRIVTRHGVERGEWPVLEVTVARELKANE